MTASTRELHRSRARCTAGGSQPGVPVLDVIYLALTLALFALVGLIAKGAARLGPRSGAAAHRGAMREGERG